MHALTAPDIRTWHSNIEQHASEGVNKILIGNKCDWSDKRAVSEEAGRELAAELGVKFMETSAKVNEGVEEAFFSLARYVLIAWLFARVALLISLPAQGHQDPTHRLPRPVRRSRQLRGEGRQRTRQPACKPGHPGWLLLSACIGVRSVPVYLFPRARFMSD
jgi:hypothetical protein